MRHVDEISYVPTGHLTEPIYYIVRQRPHVKRSAVAIDGFFGLVTSLYIVAPRLGEVAVDLQPCLYGNFIQRCVQ